MKLAPAVFWVTTNACPPVLVVAVTNTFDLSVTAVVSTSTCVSPAAIAAVPTEALLVPSGSAGGVEILSLQVRTRATARTG